jgi:hypothetical protein
MKISTFPEPGQALICAVPGSPDVSCWPHSSASRRARCLVLVKADAASRRLATFR